MPYAVALKEASRLISDGRVKVKDIDRMAKSILRTYFAMNLGGRKREPSYLKRFKQHESVALQTAREGIILLKNEGGILPLKKNGGTILLTGDYVETLAMGGGSATVQGYNNRLTLDELRNEFGDRILYVKNPTPDQIRSSTIVLCNVGTSDSEYLLDIAGTRRTTSRLCILLDMVCHTLSSSTAVSELQRRSSIKLIKSK